MTPIEIACRFTAPDGFNCQAQAGQACDWTHWDYTQPPEFHACRVEDAAAMTRVSDPVDEKNFDEAVEESGLV